MPDRISREEHALRHGPTAGDRVRLGDTDLWIRIEEDLTEPGDQALWGYAKNWRSRMTQQDRATTASELDAVIGSVIVVDPLLGIVKCDLGIKDGRIVGIGRAGNPDITDGVDLTIGPNTWPIPCHGLIATPAVIDSHVHLLSPRLVPVALSAGVTTLITAGFEEPPSRMLATLRAFEHLPVNVGLQPSARTDVPGGLDPVIEAGAVGLKIHEDWGAYPEIVDATLRAADTHDVAVCLHTDSLNESTELAGTIEAIGGRTVHAYHVEGSGGGHIPDALGLTAVPNVLCSSTTPTLPYGPATASEQLDMKLIVHEGNPGVPEDVAAARELVHPATMAAEGPLHELGAIQIVNSDSQGMGRI
ncbi:MAG: urease subunit alpha, partial [Actinomycetota bacterium]